MDPASFCLAGGNMGDLVGRSQDIFLFYIHSLGASFNAKPLNEKLQISRELIGIIARVTDPLKQDLLIHQAAQHLTLSRDVLTQAVKKTITHPSDISEVPETTTHAAAPFSHISPLEKKLLCAILTNTAVVADHVEQFLMEYTSAPFVHILKILKMLRGKSMTPVSFTDVYEKLSENQRNCVNQWLIESEADGLSEKDFLIILQQFQRQQWKIIIKEMQYTLNQAQVQGDWPMVQELMNKVLVLRNKFLQ
jgi:hypothetical protein